MKKRNHYISQFYLKNFSNDDKTLCLYDRYKDEFRTKQSIDAIAFENHLYRVEGPAEIEQSIEDLLMFIEGKAKPSIDKLISCKTIDLEERSNIALFIAFMMVRVPYHKKKTDYNMIEFQKWMLRHTFSNIDYVKKILEETGYDSSPESVIEVRKFAIDPKKYTIEVSSNYWLKTMVDHSRIIHDVLYCNNWEILHFVKQFSLITSDNPVYLVPPKNYHKFFGYGIATPGSSILIPLSSNCCLVSRSPAENPVIEHFDSPDKILYRTINQSLAINCDRFIYSSQLGKLNKIVKDTHIGKPLINYRSAID